jgi:L-lactate dehydrogenase complex protein LldG
MTTREEMLGRIRKALGRSPADRGLVPEGFARTLEEMAGVMPPLPPEEWLTKFEAEWAKVGGTAHRAANLPELDAVLQKILSACEAKSVVFSGNPLLATLNLVERVKAWGTSVSACPASRSGASEEAKFRQDCFAATVGITGVDFVLAETGSLALSSATEGSQLASLAPPVHVALYRRKQLVGSLDDLLEKVSNPAGSSALAAGRSIVFITGTSRTADIEQILIRGVHGPREVHAILVEDSCL